MKEKQKVFVHFDFAVFSKKEILDNREKVSLLYDKKLLDIINKYSNMKNYIFCKNNAQIGNDYGHRSGGLVPVSFVTRAGAGAAAIDLSE